VRLLVTGAGGQLGADLVRAGDRHDVVGLTRAELDVTDRDAVEKAVLDVRPDVVLNASAYTAVDAAETDEAGAAAVNAAAPAHLARACALHGAGLVHVSTDYVFAGDATRPYEPGDPTGPTSAYGRTKLAGEQAVRRLLPDRSWIVRTAWVYGAGGGNFVRTIARLEGSRDTVDVVDDQRGSPTWSRDLADGLLALVAAAPGPGIYHCTNAGETTWYGLARAVFEELGADPDRVRPTTTAAFPRPAPRPAYSVLSPAAWLAAGLPAPRPWREALHAAFAEVGAALRPV
jgi:dTDP-4-dehydrorhamnose reductase